MARLPYPDGLPVTPDRRNLGRMFEYLSPNMLLGFRALMKGIRESPLDTGLRELAILRVGYLHQCQYEMYHHKPSASYVGMSDRNIEALTSPNPADVGQFLPVELAAIAFVDDMVRQTRPSDASLAKIREFLSPREILDLVCVSGGYTLVCRLIETTGVELDSETLSPEGRGPKSVLLAKGKED